MTALRERIELTSGPRARDSAAREAHNRGDRRTGSSSGGGFKPGFGFRPGVRMAHDHSRDSDEAMNNLKWFLALMILLGSATSAQWLLNRPPRVPDFTNSFEYSTRGERIIDHNMTEESAHHHHDDSREDRHGTHRQKRRSRSTASLPVSQFSNDDAHSSFHENLSQNWTQDGGDPHDATEAHSGVSSGPVSREESIRTKHFPPTSERAPGVNHSAAVSVDPYYKSRVVRPRPSRTGNSSDEDDALSFE
eukprot:Selendium_serpulae@DN796_c0_g1_i1.p1